MATKDWYAQSLDELLAWWANFILRRPEFEGKYPILKTLDSELNAIGAWVAYWVPFRNTFDESSKQLTRYFNTITGNDPNEDPPTTYSFSMTPGAPPDVPPGIEYMIRGVRREVTGLSNYAKADGEALGFEATTSQPIAPTEVKPSLRGDSSAHDYEVAFVVTGRNGVASWDLYLTRKGGTRTKYGTYDGKSANVIITPTVPGDAEQVVAEVQLRKSNVNYGQPSNPIFVTINP